MERSVTLGMSQEALTGVGGAAQAVRHVAGISLVVGYSNMDIEGSRGPASQDGLKRVEGRTDWSEMAMQKAVKGVKAVRESQSLSREISRAWVVTPEEEEK